MEKPGLDMTINLPLVSKNSLKKLIGAPAKTEKPNLCRMLIGYPNKFGTEFKRS
jgi:hypothetical protein